MFGTRDTYIPYVLLRFCRQKTDQDCVGDQQKTCLSHVFVPVPPSQLWYLNGPGHAKMCLMDYANNKGADQPAHPRSLISTFVVRCLDSMTCILAISKVSRF